jgi:hypothetical protein
MVHFYKNVPFFLPKSLINTLKNGMKLSKVSICINLEEDTDNYRRR